MSNSFVKRAPEIAEEILLKAAESHLPSDLKSFQRSLLTKEASDDREKLVLPQRMSLADLQKTAGTNKVSLPLVKVSSDDWGNVAGDLLKVASRHEQENAREIFESAAAMVAHKKEAAGVRGVRVPGRPAVYSAQPQSMMKRVFGGEAAQSEHAEWRANRKAHMAGIPGTKEHGEAQAASAMKSDAAAKSEAEARSHSLREKAVTHTAPLMAAAVGVPMAAMAMRRDPAKKEEVKIYK